MFLGKKFRTLMGATLLAGAGVLALGAAAAQAETIDQVKQKGELTVGMLVDFPPYGIMNSQNQPDGYDADVAKVLAKDLGVKLKIVPVTGPNRIPFLLTNKVWSPQYVLWLLPLVALARPKLPAYLLWQAGEIVYFFGIWWYLLAGSEQTSGVSLSDTLSSLLTGHAPADGIDLGVYTIALLARFLTVLMMAVLIVIDILVPRLDVVRADGADDPAGGVLDGAADRFRLARRTAPQPA